jgi:hypothetical protein
MSPVSIPASLILIMVRTANRPTDEWMHVPATPLEPHPNDPAAARATNLGADRAQP